jgi:hypothetical protein
METKAAARRVTPIRRAAKAVAAFGDVRNPAGDLIEQEHNANQIFPTPAKAPFVFEKRAIS